MHNIAIIGAGRIGKIHAANATAHPGVTLKYVVDPITPAAEELAAYTGAAVAALLTVGESPVDPALAPAEVAAWTLVASQFLNLDEFLTK